MTKTVSSARTLLLAAATACALLFLPQVSLAARAQQSNAAQRATARLSASQFKNVKVTVNNGVATLTGTVKLYDQKEKAGNIAKGTQGVTAVKNEIQVAGAAVSDQELEQKLAPKLANVNVGRFQVFDAIGIEVHDGVVTLAGQCHDYPNRNDVLALVRSTPGVKGVVDKIVVDPPSPMDGRIRQAEFRAIYGDPALHIYAVNPVKPIRIVVNNGHVELYGTVNNKMDKQIAYMRADQVPGVFGVKNYIQVAGQPPPEQGLR